MRLTDAFPNLASSSWEKTSEPSVRYNCIAWALGDTNRHWWPHRQSFWPASVLRLCTPEAFAKAFRTRGYEPCEDGSLEPGFEKVVLYLREGVPTHAARQLPSGRWTSKLGEEMDLQHELDALDGPAYGKPERYFRRPKPG